MCFMGYLIGNRHLLIQMEVPGLFISQRKINLTPFTGYSQDKLRLDRIQFCSSRVSASGRMRTPRRARYGLCQRRLSANSDNRVCSSMVCFDTIGQALPRLDQMYESHRCNNPDRHVDIQLR